MGACLVEKGSEKSHQYSVGVGWFIQDFTNFARVNNEMLNIEWRAHISALRSLLKTQKRWQTASNRLFIFSVILGFRLIRQYKFPMFLSGFPSHSLARDGMRFWDKWNKFYPFMSLNTSSGFQESWVLLLFIRSFLFSIPSVLTEV